LRLRRALGHGGRSGAPGRPRRHASHPGRARRLEEGRRPPHPVGSPMPRLFFPTAREWNALIVLGLVSLGYALYLRYIVIEQAWVAHSCQDGETTWIFVYRTVEITYITYLLFDVTDNRLAYILCVRTPDT